jgi:hypothetical protein
MTQQNPLDLKGSFLQHPLAELLVEVGHATLDGSLRLSLEDKKTGRLFRSGKNHLCGFKFEEPSAFQRDAREKKDRQANPCKASEFLERS